MHSLQGTENSSGHENSIFGCNTYHQCHANASCGFPEGLQSSKPWQVSFYTRAMSIATTLKHDIVSHSILSIECMTRLERSVTL
jgi:hypothetical protein